MIKNKSIRYVFIACLVIAIAYPIVNVYLIIPSFSKLLVESAEDEAVRIATYFAPDVVSEKGDLRRPSEFKEKAEKITKELQLTKLKVFSRAGEVIYSTDSKDVGKINKNEYFKNLVANGENYTKLVEKDAMSLEGQIVRADVIETYVPIMTGGSFVGAFEIYYDITDRNNKLNDLVFRSSVIPLVLMCIFLLVIIVILVKSDRGATGSWTEKLPARYRSPFYLLLILAISIFAVEAAVMVFFSALPSVSLLTMAILDSALLVMVLSPTLFFLLVRPLMINISERKKVEEALKNSKEFLETVLNSMGDAISIIDVTDFSIAGANQAFLKAYGLKEEEVLGKPCYRITHNRSEPCSPPDDICPLMDAVKTGGQAVAEHLHYGKDGKGLHVEVATSPIKDENGKVIQVVHVAKDVTRRKKDEQELRLFADKLQQSNQELQDFAYIASHDLQEPLRKVIAFGDRLKAKCGEALGEQGQDYLERMQNAGIRMQTLINDLLSFSRVTTKAQPFVPVDLGEVAQEVLCDLEVRIEQVEGRVEVAELPAIDADPLQMRQLLQNLIGNALKFSRPEEAPVVKVFSRSFHEGRRNLNAPTGGKLCQIIVEDNGIGFEEKHLERIFGLFQRLHGRGAYEGSGMGLALCKKIAQRHGGSITAQSTPGQGATFVVTLPVHQPNEGGAK